MRLGSLTQRFFSRGDDEEASGYKDVVLENAAPTSADLHFDSFDKIPRRRRPIFAMAGLLSLLAIGAVTWRIQRGHPRRSSTVAAVQEAATGHPPTVTHAAGSSGPTVVQAAVAVTPVRDQRSKTPERAIRPSALHGVVWSAAANQLVAAQRAALDQLAPAGAAMPDPSAEDTSPAHFEPAAPGAEAAPILE